MSSRIGFGRDSPGRPSPTWDSSTARRRPIKKRAFHGVESARKGRRSAPLLVGPLMAVLLLLLGGAPLAGGAATGAPSVVATKGMPANYTYSVTCSGGSYIGRPQWSFSWLVNGTPIPNASASQYCPWGGSGSRPGNANGLRVGLLIFVSPSAYASKSTTKSFGANRSVSVKLTVSLTLKPPTIFCFSPKHCSQKVTETISFTSP